MRPQKARTLPARVWTNTSSGNGIKHWDGSRRDPDLYVPASDCLVYFHHEGQSQRGPSIQIPVDAVLAAKCTSILPNSIIPSTRRDKVRLYLAPPLNLSFVEVQRWNITTRNFFAWMLGKPLVGEHLGPALETLLARMKLYRDQEVDNLQDILVYAERLGYLDFTGQPEYALGLLYFAEKTQIGPLWIDSFTHCVGMDPYLAYCSEVKPISRSTKTYLTRTYLTVQLKIERGLVSLGNLLDAELSQDITNLTFEARMHVIEFRAFLHSYCSANYGNWPPTKADGYPKVFLEAMQADFNALYHYLADHGDTTGAWASSLPSGEIPLSRSIDALNNDQGWNPLLYKLPLLPHASLRAPESASRGFFRFERSNKREKRAAQQYIYARQALQSASNRSSDVILSSPLVQAYEGFECEESVASEALVNLADGRKIRWLLVYGILQKLLSLTTAPAEVSDPISAVYPLCCDRDIALPWEEDLLPTPSTPTTPTGDGPFSLLQSERASPNERRPTSPPLSVHPDCEAMGYYDFKPVRISQLGDDELAHPHSIDNKFAPRRSSTLSILSKTSWLNRVTSRSNKPVRSATDPSCNSADTTSGSAVTVPLKVQEGEEDKTNHEVSENQENCKFEAESPQSSGQGEAQMNADGATLKSSIGVSRSAMHTRSDQDGQISPPKLSIPPLTELDEEEQSSPSSVEQDGSPISSGCSTISTLDESPFHDKSPNITYIPAPISSPIWIQQKEASSYQTELLESSTESLVQTDEAFAKNISCNVVSSCMLNIPHCQCTGTLA